MSSQDRLENVLRDFHVMISKSEVCDTDRIIVSKNSIFDLIDRLNACIYEIMDEYEMTQQSRDRALREHKKEGDRIIWDASRQAEDIYAASVMYTQEALGRLNRVVEDANVTISHLYREFGDSMKQQQETIRENELELKSQLQLLSDTEKYMSLIEERNREIEREEAEKKGRKVVHSSEKAAAVKPEIKINEEYFRKAGISLDDYVDKEPEEEEEVLPLVDEGVIESSYKKTEVAGSQDMAGKESISQESVSQEYAGQGIVSQEYIGQGTVDQEYTGQEDAIQEYIDERDIDQETVGKGVVGQESDNQGTVGYEITDQEISGSKNRDQGYAGNGIVGQEYIGQEFVRQEIYGQEDGRQKISGQEIQIEDLMLEEDEISSKEELSFFDRLMGKKKS